MKFPRLTALLACTAWLALAGCEDTLDKMDLSAASEDLIFQDESLATLNLSYIYDQNLPTWFGQSGVGLGSTNPSILSDEAAGESVYFEGTVQINTVTDFGTALAANNNYGKVRTINSFLRALDRSPLSKDSKDRLRSQALFFRAWRYFDFVRIYGGVPLVTNPLDAVGVEAKAAAYLPRNTTSATFSRIVADLDTAIAYLPGKWTNSGDWGRVTKGAAAAFKARALLYAASPQFNPNDDVAKWQTAFTASQQAKTLLSANGFGLNASFDQLWFQEINNPEAVLVTGFNNATADPNKKSNSYDNQTRPSYTGTAGGSNQPTWELVKAFPMLDGKKPGESTKYAYSDQLFYKNRDPRFGKTIAYNGAVWPMNGNSSLKIWTYFKGSTTVEPKASNTGFYTRKAVSPTLGVNEVQFSGMDWIEIRYAEVLLNLAESACGAGNLTEAYAQLKAIRQRAGIEAGDGNYGLAPGMSRAQMFDAILYERQIELAFEGKRFWDLRRWKKIESVLNGKRRQGVTITLKSNAPADFATNRDNLDLDQVYTNYFTIAFKSLDTRYAINWKPQYYFFAIPQSAIDNNPAMAQNNTWGGAFDPLQ
ncbi:RagB/SusD family nutrient uptake outer membrane protein [Hymenobacter aquaticus]|uniref:RagB/SusD family nutrient uptake outer membrane protein n=1 Tax=Hymenobacter aquaticus TaxID=1867101 RepID=A0A4Z0Q3Z1_9BACT|nr:RagB/SusD family nutrient uptake outer membrane protein [Hymenobacter aquaticus]TGE24209.1 RagB/SusD family nutrient uptake outer membrane protein [Hymenobacter aquaticus]